MHYFTLHFDIYSQVQTRTTERVRWQILCGHLHLHFSSHQLRWIDAVVPLDWTVIL